MPHSSSASSSSSMSTAAVSAVYSRIPGALGLQSQMQASPALAALACASTFLLPPSLSLQMWLTIAKACTPKGPSNGSTPSLLRIQSAAMLELLTIFMDPFVCHWNTKIDTNLVKLSSTEKQTNSITKVFFFFLLLLNIFNLYLESLYLESVA